MNKRVKIIIGIAAFGLFLVLTTFAYNYLYVNKAPLQSPSASQPIIEPGAGAASPQGNKRPAPNFTVQDTDGNNVSFSDFKGKPIVINFWASWCPPCQAEMPDYQKMYNDYSGKGVMFMMIDLTDGSRETISTAKQFLKDKKYSFTAYFDVKYSASNAYRISTIPDSIFIDRDGYIINSYSGLIDAATMKKNIEAILK